MKKIHLNRKLFAIHSWLGLLLGFLYLLISFSGAVSVFRFELNSLIYGKQTEITTPVSNKRISYDQLFAIAKKDAPAMPYYVCGFEESYCKSPAFYSAVEHDHPRLFMTSMKYITNYLNPYNGAVILPTNSKGKNNVIDWLMNFHYSLALGEGGELFVVLLDLALLVNIITGIYFYRKQLLKVFSFKVKVQFRNWRLAASSLHRVIGTWALLFNLLIFASGLYIQSRFFTEKWWQKYSGLEEMTQQKKEQMRYIVPTVSLDSLMSVAMQREPQSHFQSFGIDCENGGGISAVGLKQESVFQAYDNYFAVNFDNRGRYVSTTYTPWKDYEASRKFYDINFSLFHTGWALGTVGKIVWCIMGFTPAILSITGFMLWWRRVRSSR